MSSNAITNFTCRDLFDRLRIDAIDWADGLGASEFSERVVAISKNGE